MSVRPLQLELRHELHRIEAVPAVLEGQQGLRAQEKPEPARVPGQRLASGERAMSSLGDVTPSP